MKFNLSFLIAIPLLFGSMGSFAQNENSEQDTTTQKQWGISESSQLGDSVWWALQQKDPSVLMSLIPTSDAIKETFDSLEFKANPQSIKIRRNRIYFKVNKQLRALNARAKANKLKFKTCEKDKIEVKEGKYENGTPFAYVTLFGHKGKRAFFIKFVAIKLNQSWYVLDELKIEFPEDNPYYKAIKESPVKIKKKQKN